LCEGEKGRQVQLKPFRDSIAPGFRTGTPLNTLMMTLRLLTPNQNTRQNGSRRISRTTIRILSSSEFSAAMERKKHEMHLFSISSHQ
jgi:hypothetical protein